MVKRCYDDACTPFREGAKALSSAGPLVREWLPMQLRKVDQGLAFARNEHSTKYTGMVQVEWSETRTLPPMNCWQAWAHSFGEDAAYQGETRLTA